MLPDALLFDFDGVIVDTEPVHYEGFARVLRRLGRQLDRKVYYERYLGYDDRDGFAAILTDHGLPVSDTRIAELTAEKAQHVHELLAAGVRPIEGAGNLLKVAAGRLPIAVCSGALRQEIEQASRAIDIWDCFDAVVAAEDVAAGKPDPAGYLRALELLRNGSASSLRPERCVVFEDSPAGVAAGKAAGMYVVAYTTSHPADLLTAADHIVPNAACVDLESLLPK